MRLNKYISTNTSLSRRAADEAIAQNRVNINGALASVTSALGDTDEVTLDGEIISQAQNQDTVVLLNKPVGYVCSKDGQGSPTIYDLLPPIYQHLNIAGRLDKDSSGLVLLTNNGELLYKLTHPSQNKTKTYEVKLDRPLTRVDQATIGRGVSLEDGPSMLKLTQIDQNGFDWRVKMHEGRNRQIRRTFADLDYKVTKLHRTGLGNYNLDGIEPSRVDVIA